MVKVAIAIIAAIAGAIAVGLIAPAVSGHSLSGWELALIAIGFFLLGWVVLALHRGRQRRRMLDMRDSALW